MAVDLVGVIVVATPHVIPAARDVIPVIMASAFVVGPNEVAVATEVCFQAWGIATMAVAATEQSQ